MPVRGLLFDLDGTLADTAPDLVAALNTVLGAQGLPPAAYAAARNVASYGAAGLLKLGLGLADQQPLDENLRKDFLRIYANRVWRDSRLFLSASAIDAVCAPSGVRWGIVTNKPAAFTEALLSHIPQLRPECVVSGDTLAHRKPHPAPLLHAASELELDPGTCVYVGDSSRDIEAGRAAEMTTVAAAYGYIPPDEQIAAWGATHEAKTPQALLDLLARLVA